MEDDPCKVAKLYLNSSFVYDAISLAPYHIFKRDLLILRFLKVK